MKTIKELSVPGSFYKNKPFVLTKEELNVFLISFKGYITPWNDVECDEIDIDTTIRMHSGDCRIWYKNGMYNVLDAKAILMECNASEDSYETIFDWMEINIPTLFYKHKKQK